MGTWKLGRRPGLDGLRGVAILLVMCAHADHRVIAWGNAGVTMFFTLSGFLITSLLLEERTRAGHTSLRNFYARRACRLLPAFAVVLAVTVPLWILKGAAAGHALFAAAVSLGYSSNWVSAFSTPGVLGPLGHTWSLSVEEQFYLLWPLLLMLASRSANPRRWLAGICALGCVVAPILRGALWHDGAGGIRVYMGFDTRMDALLVGCALALWMSTRPAEADVEPVWSMPRSALVDGLVMVVPVAIIITDNPTAGYLALPIWLPWVTAGLIAAAMRPWYTGLLTLSWTRLVGQRSYALYLWHGVLVYFLITHPGRVPHLVGVVGMFGVAWIAAAASWRYVEQPFLSSRGRWSREPQARPVPVT